MNAMTPSVTLLGPSRTAVSGISTHLNQLFDSPLTEEFNLFHFQVGSQGRNETAMGRLVRLVFSPFQFIWHLLTKKPTIVHLNTVMRYKSYWRDLAYLLIARAMGKKIIFQIHGGALPDAFFKGSAVLTFFLKKILALVDVVVLLSDEQFRAYRNFSSEIPLALIPNGIEVGADPHWKRNSCAFDRALRVAYVGRIAESKGVFELVEAIDILVKAGTRVDLIVAGNGPDEARLRARVSQLGLDQIVRFAGQVSGAQKERIWQEADLSALPSQSEGLPYAVLESMASRTPPIVTPVGGIPDVVENGVHGLFVSYGNPAALAEAIQFLGEDRSLIRSMGEAGRRRVEEHFSSERLVRDFRKIYSQLATAPSMAVSVDGSK